MNRFLTPLSALAVVLAVAAGCGGDESDSPTERPSQESGLQQDAEGLVDCLEEADIDADVNDATPLGVEDDVVGVEADEVSGEASTYDTSKPTGVNLWVFETAELAEANRVAITLRDEDDESAWVSGRVVVDWYYAVNRESAPSMAVDACLAGIS